MRLILVRHPKPICEKGICYGRLDLECQPHALSEAVWRLGEMAPPSRVFTSPARRARDLATRLGTQLIVDERLQELNFGEWGGGAGRLWDASHRRVVSRIAGLGSAERRNADRDGGAMRLMARKPSAQRKPDPRRYPCGPHPRYPRYA
jgi:hypothetical protein